jgi:aminopeptidase N
MSTYLVALVVSDFKCKSGAVKPVAALQRSVNVSVCARPNAYDELGLAYSSAVKMLEFFENYFNISYPLTKLGI